MMHIGFLQAYFSRSSVGGGELHTERLARALESRGHEVTIFTDEPDDRRGGINNLSVREYPTPLKLNPINEITLSRRAFEDIQECDVLTLTDDSAWSGVDVPLPTVMIFHIVWHGWVQRNRPLRQIIYKKPQALVYRHMERKICRETDAIVSISPNVRNDILLIDDVESKTVDIPNGVNVERFSPIPGVTDNEFTVYFQGRLVEMKNPGLLTEAAALSEEDWELVIGGDGPLRDDLEQFVRERDIQDRVDFLGYVPDSDLPERYASADIFALPSDYEGMPLTVLEAAASGTAVLASPRAATDFVTDKMGIVLEPDPTSIAATLDKLARNPDRTVRMGEVARKRAESYSWAAVAERYESLYNDLLSRKN